MHAYKTHLDDAHAINWKRGGVKKENHVQILNSVKLKLMHAIPLRDALNCKNVEVHEQVTFARSTELQYRFDYKYGHFDT